MSTRVRTAVVQLRSGVDARASRASAEPLLRAAAAEGARVIATPECTPRLDRDTERLRAGLFAEAEDAELRAWGRLAQELGVWLLLGSAALAAADGKAVNRSFLFSPEAKIIARYDKIHLFDVQLSEREAYRESATFAAGAKAVLAEGPAGVKVGMTICYDLRFPGLYRALAQGGAEIIAVPSAFTKPTGGAHWDVLLRARAIETGAFVIAPAQGGKHEDGRLTYGHSMIVGPWGDIRAQLDHDEPGYAIADLDMGDVAEARRRIPAWTTDADFARP